MPAPARSDRAPDDGGFTSAAFAAVAFSLAIVATASVMVARQGLQSFERDEQRDREAYLLEGAANMGAARLLDELGSPTLRWTQGSQIGALVVTLEPEARKIAPTELNRPSNAALVADLVGPDDAADVAEAVSALQPAPDDVLHRSQLLSLGQSQRWRECALTLTSPYSRMTALALQDVAEPSDSGIDRHGGELWRIEVDAPDGAWLDRVVRMTGAAGDPIAVVEQASGRAPRNGRTTCLGALLHLTGASA